MILISCVIRVIFTLYCLHIAVQFDTRGVVDFCNLMPISIEYDGPVWLREAEADPFL